MPWLLANWRLVAFVAIVVGAFAAGWQQGTSRLNAKRDKQQLAAVQHQIAKTAPILEGYRADLEAIRNRPAPRRVRCTVSVPAPSGGVAGAGTADVPAAAGADIGPALFALADDADRCAAQLNRLIEVVQ